MITECDWTITDMVNRLDEMNIDHAELRLPHLNNLRTKMCKPNASQCENAIAFRKLFPQYNELHEVLFNDWSPSLESIRTIVESANKYIEVLNLTECKRFTHQSDFLSSVIPEMLLGLFNRLVSVAGKPYVVRSQDNVIIEVNIDAVAGGRLVLKKKRVDCGIFLPVDMSFRGELQKDFRIPIVVVEVKTNLDKNMISGIEYSVETMKRTFPACHYIVVSEMSDFAIGDLNYAATDIDEVFIIRKQKRGQFRRSKVRKNIDPDLVWDICQVIEERIDGSSTPVACIEERLRNGLLIGGIKCCE